MMTRAGGPVRTAQAGVGEADGAARHDVEHHQDHDDLGDAYKGPGGHTGKLHRATMVPAPLWPPVSVAGRHLGPPRSTSRGPTSTARDRAHVVCRVEQGRRRLRPMTSPIPVVHSIRTGGSRI